MYVEDLCCEFQQTQQQAKVYPDINDTCAWNGFFSSTSRDNKCIYIKYGSNGREKLELQKIQAKKTARQNADHSTAVRIRMGSH